MKIYIDFDGTLFNTDEYKEDFMNILNDYGINNKLFEKTKEELFDTNNLFNITTMVEYFIDKYNIELKLKDEIDNLLNKSYVYLDVIESLKKLLNMGYELYLLTYGNHDFQRIKINSANISNFFKDVIITEKDKSKLNLDYENSIFIDNNPREIERFHRSKAKTIIRIIRDNDSYAKDVCNLSNIPECNNFYQIVEILQGGFINE